jgi:predicted RNA-binding protein with PIN domain
MRLLRAAPSLIMRFLLDGYNLLHALEVQLKRSAGAGLERARQRLLDRLTQAPGAAAGNITVVFDAAHPPPGAKAEQTYRGVRVLFALRQEADDLIEDLIRRDPAPAELTIVSNDRRLRVAASRRGCRVLDCLDFLEQLQDPPLAHEEPAAEQPAKPDGLSAAEAQRWEDEFSDLLRDDPRLKEWFEMNESFEEE